MVSTANPALRIEPPRCTSDHPKRPAAGYRRLCPACIAWDRFVAARRRDEIDSGLREYHAEEPVKAPRCRVHRGYPVADCDLCSRWRRYRVAQRRYAISTGTLQRSVPLEMARNHVLLLADPDSGGWHYREIAAASGMTYSTIRRIASGQRKSNVVFADTWDALRTLKPKGPRRQRRLDLVDGTEARRIIQGLNCQGWTMMHMSHLMGCRRPRTARRIANGEHPDITLATLAQVRALRAKLEPYDISTLTCRLPGMSRSTATNATKRGWVPLRHWRGLDIADPQQVPLGARPDLPALAEPADDAEPPSEEQSFAFADELLKLRCDEALEVVRKTTPAAGRRCEGYITPIGRVRRFEAFCTVRFAASIGLSTFDTGALLGYPVRDDSEQETAERSASRMRSVVSRAEDLLRQLETGSAPDPKWCRRRNNGNGLNDVEELLTALLAIQPEPFGLGWSVLELSERAGIDEGKMREFLAYATRRMDTPWVPLVRKRKKASAAAMAGCTTVAA